MSKVPFLNALERWALWVLVRSSNVGMIAVKQMDGPLLFIANSPFDDVPIGGSSPMADQLERIYRSSSSDGTYQGPD
ncbi:MAG: hypothetical protein VXB01_16185 [Opitutae bacterium]